VNKVKLLFRGSPILNQIQQLTPVAPWTFVVDDYYGRTRLLGTVPGSFTFQIPLPGRWEIRMLGSGANLSVNGQTPFNLLSGGHVETLLLNDHDNTVTVTGNGLNLTEIEVTLTDNDKWIDGVKDISWTWQGQDVREPSKRKSPSSRAFTVPATSNNLEAFSQYFEVNSVTHYNPKKKVPVIIYFDSSQISEGWAAITKIQRNKKGISSFSLAVYDGFSDLFQKFGDAKMNTIDFSDYNHYLGQSYFEKAGNSGLASEGKVFKTPPGGSGSFVSNFNRTLIASGVTIGVTPLAYYPPGSNTTTAQTRYFTFTHASLAALNVGDWIFIQKNGDSEGDQWKFVGEHRVVAISGNTITISVNRAGGGHTTNIGIPNGYVVTGTINIYTSECQGFGYVYASWDNGLDSDIMTESFGPSTYLSGSNLQRIMSRQRPSIYVKEFLIRAAAKYNYVINIDRLLELYPDFARLVIAPYIEPGSSQSAYTLEGNPEGYRGYENDPLVPSENKVINPSDYLPTEKLSDFFGDIIKMFNLYVEVSERVIKLIPRSSFYQHNIERDNWEQAVDFNQWEITPISDLSGNILTMKKAASGDVQTKFVDESLTAGFGNAIISTENERGPLTQDLSVLKIVESTVCVSHNYSRAYGTTVETRRNYYGLSNKQGNGNPLRKGVRLGLFSVNALAASGYSSVNPSQPSVTADFIQYTDRLAVEVDGVAGVEIFRTKVFGSVHHLDQIEWPSTDINFETDTLNYPPSYSVNALFAHAGVRLTDNTIKGLFWNDYISNVTDVRNCLVTADIQLNQSDVNLFNLRNIIYWNKQYWIVNKLDINLTTLAGNVELMLYLGDFTFTEDFITKKVALSNLTGVNHSNFTRSFAGISESGIVLPTTPDLTLPVSLEETGDLEAIRTYQTLNPLNGLRVGYGSVETRILHGKIKLEKDGSWSAQAFPDQPINPGWNNGGVTAMGSIGAWVDITFDFSLNGFPIVNATVEYLNGPGEVTPITIGLSAFVKEVTTTGFQLGFVSSSTIHTALIIGIHFTVISII
jgi:hypothetical protein